MSSPTTRRQAFLAAVSVAILFGGTAAFAVSSASAQGGTTVPTSPTTATTATTATTSSPSTPTTRPSTTTTRAVTTSSSSAPTSSTSTTVRPTSTTAGGGTTTTEGRGTTTAPPATAASTTTTQAAGTSTTVAAKPEKVDETPASGRPWGVVSGLVGVAGLMGVLTFVYWRHTKPEDDEWYGYDDGSDPDSGPSDTGPGNGGSGNGGSAAFEPSAAGVGVAGVGGAGVGAGVASAASVAADDLLERQSPTVDLPTEAIDAVSITTGAADNASEGGRETDGDPDGPADSRNDEASAFAPVVAAGVVALDDASSGAPDSESETGSVEVGGQPASEGVADESPPVDEELPVKPVASAAPATASIFSSRPTVVVQPDPEPEPEAEPEPEPEALPGQLSMDDLRRRAEAAYQRQARDLGPGTNDSPTGGDL